MNPYDDLIGDTATLSKFPAAGTMCDIYDLSTDNVCVDTNEPIPGCCDSQDDSAICATYDDGGMVTCFAESPYPACCQNRCSSKPSSVSEKIFNDKCLNSLSSRQEKVFKKVADSKST